MRFAASRMAAAAVAAATALGSMLAGPSATASGVAAGITTAWRDGAFHVDVPGVVGRSDVVLSQPNTAPAQAMPLGNGSLGAGVWAADGLTAQLNRADTLLDRLSPGQVVIPGLSSLTSAPDFHGRLDLYDGMLTESGGGMTATAYVRANADELVVDVTGADPGTTQTAELHLWPPRTPTASAGDAVGMLSQSWTDTGRPGSSGATFGALAAVTASGRDVRATVVDPVTVQVSFRPNADGTFRVVVAAPHWAAAAPHRYAPACSPTRTSPSRRSPDRTCAGGTATGTRSG